MRVEGFTDFASRPRRLRMLLDAYGWTGTVSEVLDAVQARLVAHMQGLRGLAEAGDPLFQRLINSGVLSALEEAKRQLGQDRSELEVQSA